MTDRERELIDLILRLAERVFLAHEVLARLAEKKEAGDQ